MHGGASIRIDIITRLEDTFHFLVGKYIGRIFRLSLSNVLEINRYVCIISGGYKIKCKLPDAADTLHMAVPFGFIRLLFTPAIYQFFCQNGRIDSMCAAIIVELLEIISFRFILITCSSLICDEIQNEFRKNAEVYGLFHMRTPPIQTPLRGGTFNAIRRRCVISTFR